MAPTAAEILHVECTSCKALLAVKEVGTYKCPRCFALFNYVGGGKANFLPRRKSTPIQLSLNFHAECTDALIGFVSRIAAKTGFSSTGTGDVERAVRETVETLNRHCYGGNPENIYHVLLMAGDAEL